MRRRIMKYRELNKPSMKFYSMEGCPHCVNSLPAFKEASRNTRIESEVVSTSTPQGQHRIQEAGIGSFPTIVGTNRNGTYMYNGDRSVNSFTDFSRFLSN